MKYLVFSIVIFILSVTAISCKSKKAMLASDNTLQNAQTDSSVKYRLIVSFLSKGAGTNVEKRNAFLEFVNQHSKKPLYKTILWGREGETDYCLLLNELNSHEQSLFVDDVKKMMAGNSLILISENAESVHKGR